MREDKNKRVKFKCREQQQQTLILIAKLLCQHFCFSAAFKNNL